MRLKADEPRAAGDWADSDPCVEVAVLEGYALGRLDEPSRVDVAQHLSGCDGCRVWLGEVSANLGLESLLDAVTPAQTVGSPEPLAIEGFRLVREIGRGGMGSVHLAEQFHPRREVAIKVLDHAGRDAERGTRLFLREIEILAQLRHPGIAAIHASGRTEQGRPWFAMEYIEGEHIVSFAEARGLERRERLELFLQVVEAMAHAHRRGVIHRDLKPANILVTHADRGAPPRVKILDFGLGARRDADGVSVAEAFSSPFGRIFGTLPFMSPEQARGDMRGVDTRSDVYSLGALLYLMLTGSAPHDLARRTVRESIRIVGEGVVCPPSSLVPGLRGDCEAVILKAIDPQPERRYDSAGALAEEVRRLLAGLPVDAHPPTLLSHARRLVARHRLPAALVALLALSLSAWGAVAGAMSVRLSEKEAAAESARATTEARLGDIIDQTSGFLLDSVVARLAHESGMETLCMEMAEQVDDLYARLLIEHSDDERLQLARAASRRAVAGLLIARGDRSGRAVDLMEESHAAFIAGLARDPHDPDRRFQLAYSTRYLARALGETDEQRSERLWSESNAGFAALIDDHPGHSTALESRRQFVAGLRHQAARQRRADRHGDAIAALRESAAHVAEIRRLMPADATHALLEIQVALEMASLERLAGGDSGTLGRARSLLVESSALRARSPNWDDAIRLVAECHLECAELFRSVHDRTSAGAHAEEARTLLFSLAAAEPHVLPHWRRVASASTLLALIAEESGDIRAATEWAQQAADHFRRAE